MLIPTDVLKDVEVPKEVFDPAQPATTMIVGSDRRVIMGPGRKGTVCGIVALIPDELTGHFLTGDTWVSKGSLDAVLNRYSDFPTWLLEMFKRAPDTALWQLRDIDPLPNWVRGRSILIGDAAHAMLPTQGQGASQSFEDAEALYAFLADLPEKPSAAMVGEALQKVFESRYERVSLIQAYSRQQAQSGTDSQTNTVSLNPAQFMQYNCKYDGAKDWIAIMAGKETTMVAP
jgi:salicylate hydroxylase